jgi:hypothetical protein
MRFAREEDSQEIYELYQKNRKFFPNITIGHISNRIKKESAYTLKEWSLFLGYIRKQFKLVTILNPRCLIVFSTK